MRSATCWDERGRSGGIAETSSSRRTASSSKLLRGDPDRSPARCLRLWRAPLGNRAAARRWFSEVHDSAGICRKGPAGRGFQRSLRRGHRRIALRLVVTVAAASERIASRTTWQGRVAAVSLANRPRFHVRAPQAPSRALAAASVMQISIQIGDLVCWRAECMSKAWWRDQLR